MPISNSPHIFSPLSVKTLEDLKQSRFEIHLSRVILTQNGTSDPKRYSGAGIIRQTNDGKFELVLFSDEPPDIGSWMESINNKCVKFWDENDFFDLEGVDFDRTKWVAKKLQLSHFPHVPQGGKSRIVGRFEELFVEKDIRYKQGKNPEMASITIWIAEHVDSPLNTSPKIVADKFEFSLEFDPVTETTIVKVVFPRELYFDELLNRIFETVQITHFRFLSPILAIIKNGKSKLLQVRGINPDARLISEEQRPVFFYLADESDHVEFFSKFFCTTFSIRVRGVTLFQRTCLAN